MNLIICMFFNKNKYVQLNMLIKKRLHYSNLIFNYFISAIEVNNCHNPILAKVQLCF